MRLKPEKIENLAEVIFEALTANKEVGVSESREKVTGLIRQIITADMKAEEEIEAEAHKKLEAVKDQIARQGASYDKLFQKAKQQIARERKMVI